MKLASLLTMIRLLRIATGRSRAYMDPGSGSMLLQVLLGGVAGIAVVVRLFWYRIVSVLRIGRKKPDDTTDDDTAGEKPGTS